MLRQTKTRVTNFSSFNRNLRLIARALPILVCSCFLSASHAQSESTREDSIKLAQFYWAESDRVYNISLDSCLYYTRKAQQVYEALGDWSKNIFCLNAIATLAAYNEQMAYSMQLQDSIVILAEQHLERSDPVLLNVYNNQLANERLRGNYSKALDYAQTILSLIAPDNLNLKSIVYLQTGYLYKLMGEFEKGAEMCLLSLELKEDIHGKYDIKLIDPLLTLAYICEEKKEYNNALEYFEDCKSLLNKNKSYGRYDSRLNNILLSEINLYQELNDLKKSQELLNNVRNRMRSLTEQMKGDYYSLLSNQLFLAHPSTDFRLLDSLTAISNNFYSSAMSDLASDDHIAKNYIQLSEYAIGQSKYEQAEHYLTIALDSIGGNKVFEDPTLNNVLALEICEKNIQLAKLSKDIDKESDWISRSIELSKIFTRGNKSAKRQKYWAEKNQDLYTYAVEHFSERDNLEKTFYILEQNKSNLLLNELLDNETFNAEARSIQSRLDFVNLELRKNSKNSEDNNELLQLKTKLEIDLDRLRTEQMNHSPTLSNLAGGSSNSSLAEVQKNLERNEIIIEYFVSTSSVRVLGISNQDVDFHTISEIENLKRQIRTLNELVSNPDSDELEIKQYAQSVYNHLLRRILSRYGNTIDKITIIPDDFLNNFSFELLNDGENYVGLSKDLSYQYSVRLKEILKTPTRQSKEYFISTYAYQNEGIPLASRACVNELPGSLLCASEEIESIKKWKNKKQYSIQSKHDFINVADKSSIIHLATHACFDQEESDLSRIYFSEGILNSFEIQAMQIPADLVVLSACETGLGEVLKGEGSISIAKNFFHAGVKSALVSLWAVDDCSTSDLMSHFYEHLYSGKDIDKSIRKARESYVNSAHHSRTHPYYWAGFTVIGNTKSITSNNIFSHISIPILILTVCTFVYILIRNFRK